MTDDGSNWSSTRLENGAVYSREELRRIFGIKDATINNGIFRPRGWRSVWVFVTEHKQLDRRQYVDQLRGDDLFMDGQTSGRTDRLLIDHELEDLEILVFHRYSKSEHPRAGFRFEGKFRYLSHSGGEPSHFHLRRMS